MCNLFVFAIQTTKVVHFTTYKFKDKLTTGDKITGKNLFLKFSVL